MCRVVCRVDSWFETNFHDGFWAWMAQSGHEIEIQQRKSLKKKVGVLEITWCHFQRLKMRSCRVAGCVPGVAGCCRVAGYLREHPHRLSTLSGARLPGVGCCRVLPGCRGAAGWLPGQPAGLPGPGLNSGVHLPVYRLRHLAQLRGVKSACVKAEHRVNGVQWEGPVIPILPTGPYLQGASLESSGKSVKSAPGQRLCCVVRLVSRCEA